MSRQAYRLERHLGDIRTGAQHRLGNARAGQAVWVLATRQVEFGHLVVAGYREGRYVPAASLVRTLFEDATLLAWMAVPDESEVQTRRTTQVIVSYYKDIMHKGPALPPDAAALVKTTTGKAARKPPSWEDRVRQLDVDEQTKADGKPFWASHVDHVEMLNDYVHSGLGGSGQFTDPMTRELLGFEALVFGHQYLTLSVVSIVRLSDQNALAARAQAAFARVHGQEMSELNRLLRM